VCGLAALDKTGNRLRCAAPFNSMVCRCFTKIEGRCHLCVTHQQL